MRDFLRRFKREAKFLRGQRFPILDRLRRGNAMKRVIDLSGGKSLRVKRQHFAGRQIFGVKISLPLRVLETRSSDPKIHAIRITTDHTDITDEERRIIGLRIRLIRAIRGCFRKWS